jgi:hypothetical protein
MAADLNRVWTRLYPRIMPTDIPAPFMQTLRDLKDHEGQGQTQNSMTTPGLLKLLQDAGLINSTPAPILTSPPSELQDIRLSQHYGDNVELSFVKPCSSKGFTLRITMKRS